MSFESVQIAVVQCSWILEESQCCTNKREELPKAKAVLSEETPSLAEFSIKNKLCHVKGYLDKAAHYLLGATKLLPENTIVSDSGVAVISQYGAVRSAWTFFDQLKTKGAHFASPMIFPHGYANTAADLLSMEYHASGPHMTFSGSQSIREAWEFAVCRLLHQDAPNVLLGAVEAAESGLLLPPGMLVRNGAVLVELKRVEDLEGPLPLFTFLPDELSKIDGVGDRDAGQVENMIRSLSCL
ncbi:MAG: hypothetical protein WCS73_12895 [Lentisphaeria bacterium]